MANRERTIRDDAVRLEAILPRLMRVLLPSPEVDPLGAIPLGQIRLMRTLSAGPRLAADAGHELGLSPSALSQMVHRLEEAGLVQREDFATDKRHRQLRLTPEGVHRMAERSRIRAERAETALVHLTAEERAQLIHLLERVVAGETALGPLTAIAEASRRSPY
jgi:DNA-binding MarR family transcriptional regulator